MQWIWEHHNWPKFEYNSSELQSFEREFYQNSGKIMGAVQHLTAQTQEMLRIDLLCQEAVATSHIEGEVLDRLSVQSSIRKHLGLKTDYRKTQANAEGVSEMMVDLYINFSAPLSHELLHDWHKMLMNGRRDVEVIGHYRQHEEPMQIVSGNYAAPKLFYEAPPSERVFDEMEGFINWYRTELDNKDLLTLAFAGIVHLYFEIIHPFEDGNGRIGRALAEKAISQRLNFAALNSFTKVIGNHKKEYYSAIQACNHSLSIDLYLQYFAKLALEAQNYTLKTVEFLINKAKFFDKFQNQFNQRQEKVLLRVFEAGIEGFKGGLSANNYQAIAKTSPATTTRDLQELVALSALIKQGQLRHSRYFLNLE